MTFARIGRVYDILHEALKIVSISIAIRIDLELPFNITVARRNHLELRSCTPFCPPRPRRIIRYFLIS